LGFFSFLPFIFLRIYLDGAFRASGDTKTPLLITVVVNLINLGLDPDAQSFPGSLRASAGRAGEYKRCGHRLRRVHLHRGRHPGHGLAETALVPTLRPQDGSPGSSPRGSFVLAAPSTFEIFSMALSQVMVLSIAVNPLGKETIASFHIVLRLASLSFIPGPGLLAGGG
jgi:hypothetical protein